MRLIDTELLKEIIKDLPALLAIIGTTLAIMVGLLLGVYLTNIAIEAFVESLFA